MAANFAPLYGNIRGTLTLPPIELTTAILPSRRSRISGTTARIG